MPWTRAISARPLRVRRPAARSAGRDRRLADVNDLADLRRLNRPRLRAIHFQGLVTAPAVVVGEVVLEDPPEVRLAEHHDAVEAFATDAADHPLHVRRLPRTPRRDDDLLDAHRLDPPAPLKDGPLMAEGEDLELEGGA